MTDDVKIFAKTIEKEARDQIDQLAAHPVSDNSKIRIMPDVHAGAGCTIGTTMTITDRICPNLVGVDIGCGMLAARIKERNIDLDALDKVIRWNVPCGFNINHAPKGYFDFAGMAYTGFDDIRAQCSIGSLGGGNHIIEVDRDKHGSLWIVIHSGSRHLGFEVASYYQKRAFELSTKPTGKEIGDLIHAYKEAGRDREIAAAIQKLKADRESNGSVKDLCFLTSFDKDKYLNDMDIIQKYAAFNRKMILRAIIQGMSLTVMDQFETIHNYVDVENMILRKGAVSAQNGERLLIPMNMRDGSLICEGKGNPDWNFSAPHGAGRLMSRAKAKETFTVDQYRASMDGIKSTCISYDTLDEAPFVYKDMQEIVSQIKPTCQVIDIIKPIYNFKASS